MRTSIQSALLQGFTVLRTRNADDTARQLAALTRALERQCRARSAALLAAQRQRQGAAVAAGGAARGAAGAGGAGAGAVEEADADDPLPTYEAWEEGLKSTAADMKVAAMWGLMLTAVPGETERGGEVVGGGG